jgi:hypothetical protein
MIKKICESFIKSAKLSQNQEITYSYLFQEWENNSIGIFSLSYWGRVKKNNIIVTSHRDPAINRRQKQASARQSAECVESIYDPLLYQRNCSDWLLVFCIFLLFGSFNVLPIQLVRIGTAALPRLLTRKWWISVSERSADRAVAARFNTYRPAAFVTAKHAVTCWSQSFQNSFFFAELLITVQIPLFTCVL